MALAAVAGATFFTANIFRVPLPDFITELIDFADQFLIVPERLQFIVPFLADLIILAHFKF